MYGKSKEDDLTKEVKTEMSAMSKICKLKYAPPPSEPTIQATLTMNDTSDDRYVSYGGRSDATFKKRRIRGCSELDIYLRDLR
ncbi:unnamed protein product [Linum trigynum]|uniref:Uncharacterized protein n=1 Tax=Linum trigynum TaxID=586398 RepID=A0AAV2F7J0_9ROSI